MKEKKNKSKEKLNITIIYAVVAVVFGILAVMEAISQKKIPSLTYIGLIIVNVGLAMENYMKYRKDKDKQQLVEGMKFMKENPNTKSTFSFEERKKYYKKKWRKEHISLFIILLLILAASIVLPFVIDRPYFLGLVPLIAFIEYGYQNNKMMIYVEKNLYD
ncbi:MAG: transcriptional regulator [Ruminococcus sp.]